MNVNQDSGTSPTANAVIAMDTLTFVIHVQESVSIARATPLGLNVKGTLTERQKLEFANNLRWL